MSATQRRFGNLHLPYKEFMQQRGRELGKQIDVVMRSDQVTPDEYKTATRDIFNTQSKDHRNNWLELERWADRLRDEVGQQGSPPLIGHSGLAQTQDMRQRTPTTDSGWAGTSYAPGIIQLVSGVPNIIASVPMAIQVGLELNVSGSAQYYNWSIDVPDTALDFTGGSPYGRIPITTSLVGGTATITQYVEWVGWGPGPLQVNAPATGGVTLSTMRVNFNELPFRTGPP